MAELSQRWNISQNVDLFGYLEFMKLQLRQPNDVRS